MKSTLFALILALCLALIQSRRHYWGTDGIESPLYGNGKKSEELLFEKKTEKINQIENQLNKIGLEAKFDKKTPNKTPYLLAMNRRAPGPSQPLTLHGLWYQYAQDCQNDRGVEEWNVRKLAPIRDELEQWWPSFNTDNDSFWTHEALKHNSCHISQEYKRNHTITYLQSFQFTLNLLHKYTHHCDNVQMTDCRCDLDADFNIVSCRQKA